MKAIKQSFDTNNFGKTDRANGLMDAVGCIKKICVGIDLNDKMFEKPNKSDVSWVGGEFLVYVKKSWVSYGRHANTSSFMALHKPVAAKEHEESERISRERYCYSEHPKFMMVFCRRKPNHEGRHRSYSGIIWGD
jgi:hypothetical protein